LELWHNAEINEYLRAVAIESEKERLNTQADNQAMMLWLVQSVGFLHACLHNSGMAGYDKKLSENPVFAAIPERIRKLLGMEEKKKEPTDLDIFLLTATRSQKKEYYERLKVNL